MNVYGFGEDHSIRRRYLRGISSRYERRRCSTCCPGSDYPVEVNTHNRDVKLHQGSFVSNILWDWGHFHVTDELKNALQKEGFEGIAFEPIEIVEDERPSKDKKKLPLEQIPQFYHVKLLTGIPQHQDYLELYGSNKYCPACGRSKQDSRKLGRDILAGTHKNILDVNHYPGTDIFGVDNGDGIPRNHYCTERGKAFLESYPKTYFDCDEVGMRA